MGDAVVMVVGKRLPGGGGGGESVRKGGSERGTGRGFTYNTFSLHVYACTCYAVYILLANEE